ncbi:NFACT family protein [bacterium]|nr:NFACT family protein [bacterium]
MITFDYLTLKAFFEENKNFFENARIQKIQSPSRRDLILYLRALGETKKLYININPQFFHICFLTKENENKLKLEIPKQPTMFCMLLRKYIENGKIAKVNVPQYERIFEIFIDAYNEMGDKIYLCLSIELMGKYSNIVLYNTDTNIIIGCCHNVGEEKSREREMAGLLPYTYPPKQFKIDILNYNGEIENLNQNFYGISKAFAAQIKNCTLDKIQSFMRLDKISPSINRDFSEYSLFSELLNVPIAKHSVNDMISDYFTYHQLKILTSNLKQNLFSIAYPKYKKQSGTLEKIEKQLKKEEKAKTYRLYGDLLMANLHTLHDYSKTVVLNDWNTNENVEIQLDETKTIKDNANRFYKLYNKSKHSSEKLTELKEKTLSEQKYLEQILFTIEQADSLEMLYEIKSELQEEKITEQKSTILEDKFKNYKILIGRNNKQNDLIVSKLSDKEDLWFHTKDCAGSHVLIKNPEKKQIDDETILYCARLAKKYSKANLSPKAGVIYTYRKNLKKPPASNLGYVTYKNETEILVD